MIWLPPRVFVAQRSALSKEGEIVSPDCPKLPTIAKDSTTKKVAIRTSCEDAIGFLLVPEKKLMGNIFHFLYFSLIYKWKVGDYFLKSENIWCGQEGAKVVTFPSIS